MKADKDRIMERIFPNRRWEAWRWALFIGLFPIWWLVAVWQSVEWISDELARGDIGGEP